MDDTGRGLDPVKLGELMLYIAQKANGDPNFGATKLYKILYFSDTEMWKRTRRSITGADYERLPNGPVPVTGRDIRDSLVHTGAAELVLTDRGGYNQHRLVPLRTPNLDLFAPEELRVVDQVMVDLLPLNASEVSDKSHGPAWQLARPGQIIPYVACLLSDKPFKPTAKDIEWARSVSGE